MHTCISTFDLTTLSYLYAAFTKYFREYYLKQFTQSFGFKLTLFRANFMTLYINFGTSD